MYSFYRIPQSLSRCSSVAPPREKNKSVLDYDRPAFGALLLLGEYFQVQGGYLDISSDAQANRQDLHGLRGQLVFIVSQHGPHTARGPGRQLRLQGLGGRGAGLP